MTNKEIQEVINHSVTEEHFISATLSSPKNNLIPQKIAIRRIELKDKGLFQWTEQVDQKAIHKNLSLAELQQKLYQVIFDYKQTVIYSTSFDYHILIGKKENVKILTKKASKLLPTIVSHNRKKEYILEENVPYPFLVELGVMNKLGKIQPQKRDKFKQINRFLEIVEDTLKNFDFAKKMEVIDFGCGKSYLTFALYYYLTFIKKFQVTLTGIDLKQDVIRDCQELTKRLQYNDLHFVLGDIKAYHDKTKVDMVVSLHACDTATDAALEKAVNWNAKIILSAPCCQHELYNQVEQERLFPLLKHGILRERFAALATDAARAQILETLGYKVQILEFIDAEHTPKNLLIKAIKQESNQHHTHEASKKYNDFKELLHIEPFLEKRFKSHLGLS